MIRKFLPSLVLSTVVAASAHASEQIEAHTDRPWRIATVRLTPFTLNGEMIGAAIAIHAIPYFDIEFGAGYGLGLSTFVRGGPRFEIADFRSETHSGWTLHAAALGGIRTRSTFGSFSWATLVATFDATYWGLPHLGLNLQASGGAMVDPSGRTAALPEARLAIGLSF